MRKGKRGRFQVEPVWCLFAAGRQPTTHSPAASALSVPSCSALAVNTEGLFPYLDRGCFVSQMTSPRCWPIGECSQKRKLLAKASPRLCVSQPSSGKPNKGCSLCYQSFFFPRTQEPIMYSSWQLSSGTMVGKLSCSQIHSTFLRLA